MEDLIVKKVCFREDGEIVREDAVLEISIDPKVFWKDKLAGNSKSVGKGIKERRFQDFGGEYLEIYHQWYLFYRIL